MNVIWVYSKRRFSDIGRFTSSGSTTPKDVPLKPVVRPRKNDEANMPNSMVFGSLKTRVKKAVNDSIWLIIPWIKYTPISEYKTLILIERTASDKKFLSG